MTNSEIKYRTKLAKEQQIRRARFPIIKRLAEFDYDFQPSVNKQQINDLATMSFVSQKENIILMGSPGVGKTHLAIGLGIEACEQDIRTLFINCYDLILRLQKASEKDHLERVMRRYERYDLLILDELGYLPGGWEKTPGQIKKPDDESKIDSLFGFLYTQKIVPDMM